MIVMDTRSSVGALSEVASELTVVVGRFVRRVRQLHEQGELTLSELSVLARLDRGGPLSAGLLAEQERVTPQAMSQLVATLEERGMVARAADPGDARRFRLSVTPAARRLLAGRRSTKARQIARALAATLTTAEQRQLAAALPLLDRVTDGL
jgi:DNA-binding MarR family transcriptional regulator